MFLERRQGPHQYGIYSTSFAIQLLARSPRIAERATITAIVEATTFLARQFEAHRAAESTPGAVSKQADKRRELGHTDFDLVLKHSLVLEGLSTLTSLREAHADYNHQLATCHGAAATISDELASMSIESRDAAAGTVATAWPWHRVGEPSLVDPIPTVYAYAALLLPILSGDAYRVSPAHVERYLLGVLGDPRVRPVIKAIIVNRTQAANRTSFYRDVREIVSAAVAAELEQDESLPWQEVYHYDVLSAGRLAHYKPWIWICPRIELAEALLILTEGEFPPPVISTLHAIVSNIERNDSFRLSSTKPATLQACWRADEFLRTAQSFYD